MYFLVFHFEIESKRDCPSRVTKEMHHVYAIPTIMMPALNHLLVRTTTDSNVFQR